jgi:hypothetical protein
LPAIGSVNVKGPAISGRDALINAFLSRPARQESKDAE